MATQQTFHEPVRLDMAAAVWDDFVHPLTRAVAGASAPVFATLRDGIKVWTFSDVVDQEMHFDIECLHRWKEGSTVYPHVHLSWPNAPVNGQTVRIALEYTRQYAQGGVYAASTTIGATYTIDTAQAYDAQYGATYLALPSIDMTGFQISTILKCRIYRDVSEDNYGAAVGIDSFGIHYQVDSFGSNSQWLKG